MCICFSREVDSDSQSSVSCEVGQPLAAGKLRSVFLSAGREGLQCARGLGRQGPRGLGGGRLRGCF